MLLFFVIESFFIFLQSVCGQIVPCLFCMTYSMFWYFVFDHEVLVQIICRLFTVGLEDSVACYMERWSKRWYRGGVYLRNFSSYLHSSAISTYLPHTVVNYGFLGEDWILGQQATGLSPRDGLSFIVIKLLKCHMMWCDVMWCDVMWCWCDVMWCEMWDVMWDVMWCDVMWYMIWYDMIYDMIWYMIWYVIWYMILYDMIYDMIWYMIWYDMIWYDMMWYDMIYYNMI